MNQGTLQHNHIAVLPQLYMAMELSHGSWKLAFSDGSRRRRASLEARDIAGLQAAIAKAKEKLGLAADAPVVACYEAGRDGFWLHRQLQGLGIANVVVDPSSIEVNRRARRAKTDRLDAEKLLTMLLRYHGGESRVWSVVQVPSEAEEDVRRIDREGERLKKERTQHWHRLRSLLVLQGIDLEVKSIRDWSAQVRALRNWAGQPLPDCLAQELLRESERLALVEQQLRQVEEAQAAFLAHSPDPRVGQIRQLLALKGVGQTSAWRLVMELFGWRRFRNRRQVGAIAGLTGTPYSSGDSHQEQGISKAGVARIRVLTIQLSWGWLRHQPDSQLSRWYEQRFAHGGKRMRRIGIVAVARRLLIELWRYLEFGVVPAGASLKAARP